MGRGRDGGRPKIWGLIALHDEHPGPFEASLIRAGVRWRNVGTDDFTWGDCLALVDTFAWDEPLTRATRPNDWFWHDPLRDVQVTIIDLLAQINSKTPLPEGMRRSNLPKPAKRPWGDSAKGARQPVKPGRDWDEMENWVRSRMATPAIE